MFQRNDVRDDLCLQILPESSVTVRDCLLVQPDEDRVCLGESWACILLYRHGLLDLVGSRTSLTYGKLARTHSFQLYGNLQ